MINILKVSLFAATIFSVAATETLNDFITDIIKAWQLRLPTIVGEYLPEACMTPRYMLCLSSTLDLHELAEHVALIHINRKQDGIIFLGKGQKQVIEEVTKLAPTIWRSNSPVFMPIESSNDITLRLDSNIIFYEEQGVTDYKLIDLFAVKVGPHLRIELGKWNKVDGVSLQSHQNRWSRRTNLKGATFINCLMDYGTWGKPIKDASGNVIGSSGYFQEMLFYIIAHLNLKVSTVEIQNESLQKLENGSWTGDIGILQRKEVDVCSSGIGMKLERSFAIEYPLPTYRARVTLIAGNSQGRAMNMWAYIGVFGVAQWCIYAAMLISFVAIDSVFRNNDLTTSYSSCKSSEHSATMTAFLFAIQQGENDAKSLGNRMLILSLSILTLFMFVCYTTNITADMTSGPPEIPIRNFEDVISNGYKVFSTSSYISSFLADAPPGSAKYKVHKMHFEQLPWGTKTASKLISEPKTLWYTVTTNSLPQQDDDWNEKSAYDELTLLKTDDESHAYAALALQKDSEFLDLFNYYILKEYEHGILKRLFRTNYGGLFTREQFSINEPQALGFENVLFTFSCLAVGVIASLGIATVELKNEVIKLSRKFKQGG